jgi:uncharacterized OB-fold protein
MAYQKPIPLKNQDNKPYWDSADKHELSIQKCDSCHKYQHPPGPACSKCGSPELSWDSFGNEVYGTIYSYIISYRPFLPGFQDDLPTVIAQVELEGKPEIKITGNVLNCNPDEVKIGMDVQMFWQDINEERAIPQWKLR